jgi:hypothetical protein
MRSERKTDLTLTPKKAPARIDLRHPEGPLRDKKWEGISGGVEEAVRPPIQRAR